MTSLAQFMRMSMNDFVITVQMKFSESTLIDSNKPFYIQELRCAFYIIHILVGTLVTSVLPRKGRKRFNLKFTKRTFCLPEQIH